MLAVKEDKKTAANASSVVTIWPTVFLEGFFRLFAGPTVRDNDELALPMGGGKTSPISAVDVARAVSVVLEDPTPHIGQIYNLTGFESADLEHYARVFSEALGRTIRYRDVPLSGWSEKLLAAGVPAHVVKHLSVMAEMNKQGRYDRMTDDVFKLTGQKPISMYDFVKLHATVFTRYGASGEYRIARANKVDYSEPVLVLDWSSLKTWLQAAVGRQNARNSVQNDPKR